MPQEFRDTTEPFPFEPQLVPLTLKMIEELAGKDPRKITVVDVGCGYGRLVNELRNNSVDCHGCDVDEFWDGDCSPYLRPIEMSPYRLPYDDESVDVVISNTILEHVHDHPALYREIKRILKPGGVAIHTMPSRWFVQPGKWYLPVEPHIRVPFVHFFWPRPATKKVPYWYFKLWAKLGFRSPYQKDKQPDEVARSNAEYCATSLCYLPHSTHVRMSREIFGNCEYPTDWFLRNAYGGAARLYQKLPLKKATRWILKQTRISLMVQRKPG